MRLTILHRDEHLVAIDKPAGLLTHRSFLDFHETRFAVQLLRDQLGRKVWPVHRLDKGTSYVLSCGPDLASPDHGQWVSLERARAGLT